MLYLISLIDQARLPFIISLVAVLFTFLLKRRYLFAVITLSVTILLAYPLNVYYQPYNASQSIEKSSKSALRIIQQNCWGQNKNLTPLITEFQQRNPDIIFLQECSLELFEQICQSSLSEKYTIFHQFEFNEGLRFDNRLVVLTRGFNFITKHDSTRLSLFQIILKEQEGKKRSLKLINTHLDRPYRVKFDYYKQFTQLLETPVGPVILAGDFNLVPWSTPAQFILKELGLHDTRQGYGLHPTYPARLSYPSLNVRLFPVLPIDHIFVSPDFIVLSFETLPFIGSDHLGIQVDLKWS